MSTYDGAYQERRVKVNPIVDWEKDEVDVGDCPHKKTEKWNHGYHKRCLDCGEQLY